jgi:CHAT domain-containing protein
MIWQRNEHSRTSGQADGLAIGLSSFGGKRRDLPHVKGEISFLSSLLGSEGMLLTEKDATWENILNLRNGEGLARFAWMHIASHFFSDALTGRLSGLALWDGDVWLDELRDLSPLPALVTLSACNSLSSFVYKGDEHVDVPTTFLVAGAERVIGSLWLVLDQAAAEFTAAFYRRYLDGMSPAESVVQVQRELIEQGKPVEQWAGFLCLGAP